MTRFAIRRLFELAIVLAVVSLATFTIMEIVPGDPAAVMLGTSSEPETLAALRHQMGLDQPAPWRYLRWLGGLFAGDFGQSYTYSVPVASLIRERLAVTAPLTLLAVLLWIMVALPLGVLAAARPRGIADQIASVFALIGIAVPNFWIGLLLILTVSLPFGWLPAGGFAGWQAGFWAGVKALILPAVALAIPQAAVLTRVTRTAVLDVLGEDFIRTARAKGLTRRQALWHHAVPNAVIPIITIFGLQFSFVLAGAVVVENVFNLPGMGRLAVQALARRDVIVIENVVLVFVATVIVVNAVVDLCYHWLDPRLRDRP